MSGIATKNKPSTNNTKFNIPTKSTKIINSIPVTIRKTKTNLVTGVKQFGFGIKNYDRMFIYLSSETPEVEGKVGDTFVPAGECPLNAVDGRIRHDAGSRGVSKIADKSLACYGIWDVTDLAKQQDKCHARAQIDTSIRKEALRNVKDGSKEIHDLPVSDIKYLLDTWLVKKGQPLLPVSLNVIQADKAELFLTKIASGVKILLAEFCARFGKTIWAGVIVKESKIPLTVYASYVLTSGTSIKKEIAGYEQFKNMVFVDTADSNYKTKIDDALDAGKQVIAFLSLCSGSNRQARVDYLYNRNEDRITFVDEADFGAHRTSQSEILINAQRPNDVVILMTGTNPERAASSWNIEFCDTVVYTTLLLEKTITRSSYDTSLNHFAVDKSRNDVIVDAEFYQLDLTGLVEELKQIDPGAFLHGGIFLPSWQKTVTHPAKAKRFIIKLFENLFTTGNHDDLNIDVVTRRSSINGKRVAMMFMPYNTKNIHLEEIKNIAHDTLPGYHVISVSGHNKLSGREAEAYVKEHIEKAKSNNQHCLILASQMAQRSFSIPEITELYLAYDGGDAGTTTQRISRALTPGKFAKTAKIISLSFDPNRDDKYDVFLLETAKSIAKDLKIPIREALELVLKTIDIFRSDKDGNRIKLGIDNYLPQLIKYSRLSRVVGKISNIWLLSEQEIVDIAKNKVNISKLSLSPVTQQGKTRPSISRGSPSQYNGTNIDGNIKKVREVITSIAEHIDFFVYGANALSISSAIQTYHDNVNLKNDIESHMKIKVDLIDALIKRGVINADALALTV